MKANKKIIALLVCVMLVAATFVGCGEQPAPTVTEDGQELSRVRVILDWTPNTNHTGMYVALEKGWFAELGLDVEFEQPPEFGGVPLVGAGNAEIVVTFQEEMGPAIAAANPIPITAIAALVQHNTSGIMSLAETEIHRPRDLEGKVFASWGTDLVTEIMRHIIEADGGDFYELEIIVDFATDAISALQTRFDAIWVFYGWDAIAAQLAGIEYNYIDLGRVEPIFDFYSPILAANDTWLSEHPDQVRAFLEATARGYKFAIENPEEAAEILLRHAPELNRELVIASQKFLSGQYMANVARWGEFDRARWAQFYYWMYERGLLVQNIGELGFTNEFLPN